MEQLSGGEMIVRALEDEGVEYIFGYPGGAALHIYDAIFKLDSVPHILVRHEQAATHAADGYARATGKPGVVLVTSGPGATNAITGIATAYMDSIIWANPTGAGTEGIRAGRGTNSLHPQDHQQITQRIMHISFGLPRPL